MQPEERDAAFFWDMLNAAKTIADFISGVDFKEYLNNQMLQLAVERELEIIGEAARSISEAFKAKQPDIPWRGIIAQRNVLAHQYGTIQQGRIWQYVTTRLPKLITQLEDLIPPSPS